MKLTKKLCLGFLMGLTWSAIDAKVLFSQVPPYGPLVNGYNEKAWSDEEWLDVRIPLERSPER